ncbi:MAG: hypothetical protein K6B68_12205 [Eubacterium sp.]|nr:hypothetical protein [Eubacterium sp.]
MNLSWEYNCLEEIEKALYDEIIKVISFDMFNTLILRPLMGDQDIFDLLDPKYTEMSDAISNFGTIRMEADSILRRRMSNGELDVEDITVDDSYDILKEEFLFDDKTCEILKELELRNYPIFCQPRYTGLGLMEKAIKTGKRVIITSDMYLESDTLTKMLEKAYGDYLVTKDEADPFRIDFKNIPIYVSSEVGLRKITGNLYRKVLELENIAPEHMLHIGDNEKYDCELPSSLGIKTICIPSPISVFESYGCSHQVEKICGDLTDWEKAQSSLLLRSAHVMSANRFFDNPFVEFDQDSDYNANPYFVGYAALGTHLLSLSRWVWDNCKRDGVDEVVFLSRDGYLVKKVYDKLASNTDSKYLRVSRLSLMPVMINEKVDFYELPIDKKQYTVRKLARLLKWCSSSDYETVAEAFIDTIIDKVDILFTKETVSKDGVVKKEKVSSDAVLKGKEKLTILDEPLSNDVFQRFISFFIKNYYDEDKAEACRENIRKYISNELGDKVLKSNKNKSEETSDNKRKIAIFDMGYSGRIAAALAGLLDAEVFIYYFHTDPREHFRYERKAGIKIRTFFDFNPYMESTLREYSYLEIAPSCVGYDEKGEPLYDKGPAPGYGKIAREMQRGALDYIKDYFKYFGEYTEIMTGRYHDAAMPFEAFIRYVRGNDLEMYKNVEIDDELWGGRRNIDLNYLIEARRRKMPDYAK